MRSLASSPHGSLLKSSCTQGTAVDGSYRGAPGLVTKPGVTAVRC